MIKIEKNIPIPSDWRPKGRQCKYPFTSMKIGDSFFIATRDPKTQNAVQSSASQAGRRHNRKFTIRKVTGGLRVWRVK